MKTIRKTLSLLVTALVLIGAMPLTASATPYVSGKDYELWANARTEARQVLKQAGNPFWDIKDDIWGSMGVLSDFFGSYGYEATNSFVYGDSSEILILDTDIYVFPMHAIAPRIIEQEITVPNYIDLLRNNLTSTDFNNLTFTIENEELKAHAPEKFYMSLLFKPNIEMSDQEFFKMIEAIYLISTRGVMESGIDYKDLEAVLNNPNISDAEKLKAAYIALANFIIIMNDDNDDLNLVLLNEFKNGSAMPSKYDTPIPSGNAKAQVSITHLDGYISGYPDGSLHPERNITRYEVATVLYQLIPADDIAANESIPATKFNDAESGAWYSEAVEYLTKTGVLSGYPDGNFKGQNNVTLAEFAVIASQFTDQNLSGSLAGVSPEHWAYNALLNASNYGLLPNDWQMDRLATRQDFVNGVNRMLGWHKVGASNEDELAYAKNGRDLNVIWRLLNDLNMLLSEEA
jgi:hypothetical protein